MGPFLWHPVCPIKITIEPCEGFTGEAGWRFFQEVYGMNFHINASFE